MANKDIQDQVLALIGENIKKLPHSEEDIKLLRKLGDFYFRKKTMVSESKASTTAAGILWAYSKINFLWEGDKKWSRQGLAELFGASAKTTGDKASEIYKALKIQLCDQRFAKQSVSERDPFKKFAIHPSGMIVPKSMMSGNPFIVPMRKGKEDYFYDGLDYLDENENEKAIRCFKKAIEIDNDYVDAYNGLGNAKMLEEDYNRSKEHYLKAYNLTKEHFKGLWPSELPWGILNNRQYLRAICGLGLCFWKEKNIQEAENLFRLLLKINPGDNQGIRFIMAAILEGISLDEYGIIQEKAANKESYEEIANLFERQNKIHKFWEYE